MGPLGLSLRKLIFTMRGFDLETYGRADLHTLSDEELKKILENWKKFLAERTNSTRIEFFSENVFICINNVS